MPEKILLDIIADQPSRVHQHKDDLIFLIYTSRANQNIGDQEFNEILEKARNFNRRNRVTGYLLFNQGAFLQYIEGPNHVIQNLFTSITRDPRHSDVTLLAEGLLEERLFIDWSMGFHNLDKYSLQDRTGAALTNDHFYDLYRKSPALCCNLFEAIARYV